MSYCNGSFPCVISLSDNTNVSICANITTLPVSSNFLTDWYDTKRWPTSGFNTIIVQDCISTLYKKIIKFRVCYRFVFVKYKRNANMIGKESIFSNLNHVLLFFVFSYEPTSVIQTAKKYYCHFLLRQVSYYSLVTIKNSINQIQRVYIKYIYISNTHIEVYIKDITRENRMYAEKYKRHLHIS